MVTGILGRKIGMTQLFNEDGAVVPVTVIKAGPCVVVQRKTVARDGYDSAQLGLVEGGLARVNKPTAGHYKKANLPPTRIRREVDIVVGTDGPASGEQVMATMFVDGEQVDVIGLSRGKGFQGVMKRHGFAGGNASHGSMFHRKPGSIGASSYPSRVIKGMRGPGRMGGDRVTVRNLEVVQVNADENLLIVRGAIPGAPGGLVMVRRSVAARRVPTPVSELPIKKKK
jgi:large subunit ribosomal protein L3